MAHFAAECEKYVGTQSGGMDQAISIMGQAGVAKLICFNPVRWGFVLGPRALDQAISIISQTGFAKLTSFPRAARYRDEPNLGRGFEQRSSRAAVLCACKCHVPML